MIVFNPAVIMEWVYRMTVEQAGMRLSTVEDSQSNTTARGRGVGWCNERLWRVRKICEE